MGGVYFCGAWISFGFYDELIADTPDTIIRQGEGGIYFCGAWTGYGFHEDGIKSAVAAVEALVGSSGRCVTPWEPFSCDAKMGLVQVRLL